MEGINSQSKTPEVSACLCVRGQEKAGGTGAGHEVREVMGVGQSGRSLGKGAATMGVIGPNYLQELGCLLQGGAGRSMSRALELIGGF